MSADNDGRLGEKEYRWLDKGLRKMGFFAKLDLKTLSSVLPYMRLARYPKGRTICREGGPGDGFYLIYEGGVEVTKKGWDKAVATLRSGEFFGEMSLLFGQPRSATVRTVKPARLFVLKSQDFHRMIQKNPGVGRTMMKIAEARRRELARS